MLVNLQTLIWRIFFWRIIKLLYCYTSYNEQINLMSSIHHLDLNAINGNEIQKGVSTITHVMNRKKRFHLANQSYQYKSLGHWWRIRQHCYHQIITIPFFKIILKIDTSAILCRRFHRIYVNVLRLFPYSLICKPVYVCLYVCSQASVSTWFVLL